MDHKGGVVEIPDFKPVLTVKNSYPGNRFVLAPKPGSPRAVNEALLALTAEDE
jgi:hypothetical protein